MAYTDMSKFEMKNLILFQETRFYKSLSQVYGLSNQQLMEFLLISFYFN